MHWIAFLALPLIAAMAAWYSGVIKLLGAHPFWADDVLWIGLPVGIALAWLAGVARLGKGMMATLCLLLAASAWMLARAGKQAFAASYAEATLAGQFWYFGWIATCAFAASALATMARPPPRGH